MNDEKYMYFTERIQNTLLKPDVQELMNKEQNEGTEAFKKEEEEKKEKEKQLSHNERRLMAQKAHEERKRAMVD